MYCICLIVLIYDISRTIVNVTISKRERERERERERDGDGQRERDIQRGCGGYIPRFRGIASLYIRVYLSNLWLVLRAFSHAQIMNTRESKKTILHVQSFEQANLVFLKII